MTDGIGLFDIPHHQMRPLLFGQRKPGNHRVGSIIIRHRTIKHFPDRIVLSPYRSFRSNPKIGSSLHALTLGSVPYRLTAIESRIGYSLPILDAVHFLHGTVVKRIVDQPMVIGMQTRSHTIMVWKGHTGETGNKGGPDSNLGQRIERRRMSPSGIIVPKAVHR